MKTLVKTLAMTAAFAALATLSTGCDIFFGTHCETDPAAEPDAIGLLNPETGQCDFAFGGGGGDTCGDFGGGADIAIPDWAQCFSACTGLGETDCQAAPGCRAGYVSDCLEGLDCTNTTYRFYECWQVAPSGPIQGECANLDAYECSRHDDCVARHFAGDACDGSGDCDPGFVDPAAIGDFESCVAEGDQPPGCYGDADCGDGTVCNAADICLPPPGCGGTGDPTDPTDPAPCPAVCYGYCVPVDSGPAGTCTGDVFCDSLPPACPAETTPGIADGCWTGYCIPDVACADPTNPGACNEAVLCDGLTPDCPAGTIPGVADGCFTGYCIPLNECEPVAACADIAVEAMCIAAGCAPIYEGQDCTCDADGTCTCQSWVFASCEGA